MNEDGVVHQQKLRVLYLPAEEGPLEEEDENPIPPAENRIERGASDFVRLISARSLFQAFISLAATAI
jgi:hypothetical protein